MNNFTFQIPTEVFFGKGQLANLGKAVRQYSSKVLLVYGGGSIKRSGLYDEVQAVCKEYGITAVELAGVEPNPRIETVRAGVELCKKHNLDGILAVGGGSVIDCAKIISAGAKYDGDAWDLVLNGSLVKETLPLFTVVTIAATGSEMDRFAVISNMATNEKIGSFSPLYYPKVSILDPAYTFSVPKNQTAAGTADTMSHVIDRYFHNVTTAYLQDRLAEAILKTCIHYGPIAYHEPDNYEARANLMWASSLAIDNITWRGSEVAPTLHPLEHELSAFYDITHGVGLAILTPHWMKYILSESTVDKFAIYGVNVWGIDASQDRYDIARQAIDKTAAFYASMDIPTTLREVGINDEKIGLMAEKAAKRLKASYVPLTAGDAAAIFRAAL